MITPENSKNYKQRCDALLIALTGSVSLMEAWWKSPNKHFNNITPETQWQTNPDSVYTYLITFYDASGS